MYKVFFNARKIILAAENETITSFSNCPSFHYNKKSQLKNIVSGFLDDNGQNDIILLHQNLDELFLDFSKLFKVIDAAGGLVRNTKDQYLVIFRRGKWDLPKGKSEPNETPEDNALREVEEETGLKGLRIIRKLPDSFHCYFIKNKPVLKHTSWYEMLYSGNGTPVPQIEEDITDVTWLAPDQMECVLENTFPLIIGVLSAVGLGS